MSFPQASPARRRSRAPDDPADAHCPDRRDISLDVAGTPALDVRAERPPADAALALRAAAPSLPVIVRRRLLSTEDGTPVELRVSYLPMEMAEGTPIAQAQAIPEAWPAALATYLGKQVRLASSHVTARHPNQEEAAALALVSDAAVLVREDIHEDQDGVPSTTRAPPGPAIQPAW